MTPTTCPCGLPAAYEACCGRFHRGEAWPPTAERLMRSRYSAFAVGDVKWLRASWHPSTRPAVVELDRGRVWTRLEIRSSTGGGLFDAHGTVAFTAHYRRGRHAGEQSEDSLFTRSGSGWAYVGPVLAP